MTFKERVKQMVDNGLTIDGCFDDILDQSDHFYTITGTNYKHLPDELRPLAAPLRNIFEAAKVGKELLNIIREMKASGQLDMGKLEDLYHSKQEAHNDG